MNCENQQGSLDFQKIYKNAWQLFLLGEHRKCCKYIQETTQNYQLYDLHEPDYFRLLALHIRLMQELNLTDEIRQFQNLIEQFVKSNHSPSCELYYCYSLILFLNRQFNCFDFYVEKTIELCLESKNFEYLTQAMLAKAVRLNQLEMYDAAFVNLEKVSSLIEVLNINRLKYSFLITKAIYQIEVKKFKESLELLYQASELLRQEKSLLLHANVFRTIGKVYSKMGQYLMAKSYYQMANNLIENNECVRLGMILKEDLRELELNMQKSIDANQKWLLGENSLNHPLKGYLEFKGQQSLVILLKLLMSESNRVFSKEEIVRTLWQEEYNPLIHDNRIYVTVKRLRVFLEVNYKSPQYLIRKRGGYLFNQEI